MTNPLYKRIQEGERPDIQVIDEATIRWMKRTAKPRKTVPNSIIKKWKPISWGLVKPFIPSKKHYFNQKIYGSIHGASHATRVILFSALLCKQYNRSFDPAILLAAGFHDVRRKVDTKDQLHQTRAASWISRSNLQPQPILNQAATLLKLSEHNHADPRVRIMRDADAVDRYRLPAVKWWPKKEFLSENGIKLLDFAKYFIWRSESQVHRLGKIEAVRVTAIELGIVKSDA